MVDIPLYYIEWAYQRSWLCHKCDVITGCICKPGYKWLWTCAFTLIWWRWTWKGSWLCFLMIFMRDHFTLCILERGLHWLNGKFDTDIHSSFDTPDQYKLVVTSVGMGCIWFVLPTWLRHYCPWPWLIQIKYIPFLHILQLLLVSSFTTTVYLDMENFAGMNFPVIGVCIVYFCCCGLPVKMKVRELSQIIQCQNVFIF